MRTLVLGAALAAGMLGAGQTALAQQDGYEYNVRPAGAVGPRLHCDCLAQVRANFNPFDDHSPNLGMPTVGAEAQLNRWVAAETIYKACIAGFGVAPPANPFPYGVDRYPGGPILDPAGCDPGRRHGG